MNTGEGAIGTVDGRAGVNGGEGGGGGDSCSCCCCCCCCCVGVLGGDVVSGLDGVRGYEVSGMA